MASEPFSLYTSEQFLPTCGLSLHPVPEQTTVQEKVLFWQSSFILMCSLSCVCISHRNVLEEGALWLVAVMWKIKAITRRMIKVDLWNLGQGQMQWVGYKTCAPLHSQANRVGSLIWALSPVENCDNSCWYMKAHVLVQIHPPTPLSTGQLQRHSHVFAWVQLSAF